MKGTELREIAAYLGCEVNVGAKLKHQDRWEYHLLRKEEFDENDRKYLIEKGLNTIIDPAGKLTTLEGVLDAAPGKNQR